MPSHRDTARQFPWDRVPVAAGFTYDVAATPFLVAGWTNLATYTVPAGKKASIDAYGAAFICTGAVAGTTLRFRFAVVAGGNTYVVAVGAVNTGAVGSTGAVWQPQSGWLLAGHQVTFDYTVTGVGNPACSATAGVKLTECLA